MNIICNGAPRETVSKTVLALIAELDLNPDTVVVEYDGVILDRDAYDNRLLAEGAKLELIRFVGGG